MPVLVVRKMPDGLLVPVRPEDTDFVSKLRPGQVLRGQFKRVRNYRFLQKWFCLAKFAYDHWIPGKLPGPKWRGVVPEKCFERFRRDLIILAGYYEASYRMDGSVRIEAKSISFESMTEEDFELLYSSTVDVVLSKVLQNYAREDLDRVVEEAMRFAP